MVFLVRSVRALEQLLALVAVAARQHDGGSRQQDDHSYDGDADDIAAGAADCGTDFRLGNRLVSRLGIRLGVGLVVVRLRCWLEFKSGDGLGPLLDCGLPIS